MFIRPRGPGKCNKNNFAHFALFVRNDLPVCEIIKMLVGGRCWVSNHVYFSSEVRIHPPFWPIFAGFREGKMALYSKINHSKSNQAISTKIGRDAYLNIPNDNHAIQFAIKPKLRFFGPKKWPKNFLNQNPLVSRVIQVTGTWKMQKKKKRQFHTERTVCRPVCERVKMLVGGRCWVSNHVYRT